MATIKPFTIDSDPNQLPDLALIILSNAWSNDSLSLYPVPAGIREDVRRNKEMIDQLIAVGLAELRTHVKGVIPWSDDPTKMCTLTAMGAGAICGLIPTPGEGAKALVSPAVREVRPSPGFAATPSRDATGDGSSEPRTRTPRQATKGKKIIVLEQYNNRTVGSRRHTSFQIMHDNPGITVDEYLEKGGDSGDVAFGLKKGYIKLEDA